MYKAAIASFEVHMPVSVRETLSEEELNNFKYWYMAAFVDARKFWVQH